MKISLRMTRKKLPLLFVGMAVVVVLISVFGGAAGADVGAKAAVEVSEDESIPALWYLAPVGSVLALLFAFIFYRDNECFVLYPYDGACHADLPPRYDPHLVTLF